MPSIDRISKNEPFKQYTWDIILRSPVGGLESIPFRARSATIPDKVSEVFEINYKAEKASYAGRDASTKTTTLTFWDDEELSVQKALQAWKDFQLDPATGAGRSKSEYVGTGTLLLLNSAGAVIGSYDLFNVFIENIGEIPLTYDASEPIEITVTLRYDRYIFNA